MNFFLLDFATSCTIVSVSLVVLKIAPSLTKDSLKNNALVKFPLCATLKPPICKSAKKGCIFLKEVPPDVEYRLCPIAKLPGSFSRVLGSVK